EKFILLSHGHDGSLAVRVGFTPIRVVCQNTLSMAHGSAASRLIRCKHTRDIHCAKKLGKGESDVRSITETFRRNSTGNQSRLVEPGEQPEASLVWGGVSRTAK